MLWTHYSENVLLNTFRGITAVAPRNLWVAGYLSNPGDAGGGTEISYPEYVRQSLIFTAPAVATGSAMIMNATDITFPTSSTAAGSLTHFAIKDSATGGNTLCYVPLDEPIEVTIGVAPLLIGNELNFVSSGNLSSAYRVKMLNWLRGTDLVGITPYVALFNGNPDTGGAELSGAAYARFAAVFGSPAVQVSGQTSIATSADAIGNRAQANWGTWAFTAIMEAVTGGAVAAFAQESVSRPMREGMAAMIDAGALSISLN